MPELLILADDLTGALDSTVQFVGHVTSLYVLPRVSDVMQADVLGVDLRTRDATADTVDATLRAAWNRLADQAPRAYLKVDSAMRGHVAQMVSALLDVGAADLAVIAPAFPARSRTTSDGKQQMPGFSDESGDVDILDTLENQGLTVEHVSLSEVRAGASRLSERLNRVRTSGAVVDAERDEDLQILARAIAACPGTLPVGSAGLARAIAEEWFQSSIEAPKWDPVQRNILVVAGSRHPTTQVQVRHLTQSELATLFGLPSMTPLSAGVSETAVQRLYADIRQASQAGGDIVLTSTLHPSRGLHHPYDTRYADVLTHVAKDVIHTNDIDAIIVTGGYTAAQLCDQLGIDHLQAVAELQPGIVLSRLYPRQNHLRWLVTKAGSFGDERTLERIIKALRGG